MIDSSPFYPPPRLSLTYSYWYFSTSPGVRIFATVTPLLAWYTLTFLKKMPPFFGGVVGLAHVFAVLGHQTNLLLVPAFLGGIWCVRQMTLWQRFRARLYYLVVLTAGVLGFYGFVGRYIYFRKTYETWVWWVFSYFHVQEFRGHLQQAGFDKSKFAMVQAFLARALPFETMTDPFYLRHRQNHFSVRPIDFAGDIRLAFTGLLEPVPAGLVGILFLAFGLCPFFYLVGALEHRVLGFLDGALLDIDGRGGVGFVATLVSSDFAPHEPFGGHRGLGRAHPFIVFLQFSGNSRPARSQRLRPQGPLERPGLESPQG